MKSEAHHRTRTLWLAGMLHGFTHMYQVALMPLYLRIQEDLRLGSVEQATLLVTVMHPILAFCVVLVTMIGASLVAPGNPQTFMPAWLRTGLYYLLPSSNLLSETRFLTITRATLKAAVWTDHLTALAYGLNYALVCFVLAAWIFRSRSLSRD